MAKGRPREFDLTEALDQALLVFWRKGYRATSLEDLTDAMQINRPSLYAAFGDKENLFLKTVDHYRDKFVVPRVKKLLACDDLRAGLTEFFRSMTNSIHEGDTPSGCVIACLLSDDASESGEIKAKLADAIAGGRWRFYRAVRCPSQGTQKEHRTRGSRSSDDIDYPWRCHSRQSRRNPPHAPANWRIFHNAHTSRRRLVPSLINR